MLRWIALPVCGPDGRRRHQPPVLRLRMIPLDPRRSRVRRPSVAITVCLAALLTVAGPGAAAFGTTAGGGAWNTLGTLRAPLSLEKASGVTEIRFADDLHGWAFEPALWATTDGGATWTKQTPPGGRPVVALAGDAYAV